MESFRKAVKLDSKEPRYRAGSAVAGSSAASSRKGAAAPAGVALNDRQARSALLLARALAGRKTWARPPIWMKKAVEIEPDNPDALYHLGLIYERGQQVRDAIESFSESREQC